MGNPEKENSGVSVCYNFVSVMTHQITFLAAM